MKDRRSETSRANLGDYVPEALAPEGTTVVSVRLPSELVARLDEYRGDEPRSETVRAMIYMHFASLEDSERDGTEAAS